MGWLKLVTTFLSLMRFVAGLFDQLRTRKEVMREQKDKQDEVIDEGKVIQDDFDRMSPADRERLRDELGIYRSEPNEANRNESVLPTVPTSDPKSK